MYINTVKSLEDSFTMFKRVVYAQVWVFIMRESEHNSGLGYNMGYESYIFAGEDEKEILKKANEYLRQFYQDDEYSIIKVTPYKEILTRELREGH